MENKIIWKMWRSCYNSWYYQLVIKLHTQTQREREREREKHSLETRILSRRKLYGIKLYKRITQGCQGIRQWTINCSTSHSPMIINKIIPYHVDLNYWLISDNKPISHESKGIRQWRTPNDNEQNYPLCRFKLMVEKCRHFLLLNQTIKIEWKHPKFLCQRIRKGMVYAGFLLLYWILAIPDYLWNFLSLIMMYHVHSAVWQLASIKDLRFEN